MTSFAALESEIAQTYPSGRVGVFGVGASKFAADFGGSGLTVVAPGGELSKAVAGEYNYTIWLEAAPDDRVSRANATAIIDVSNPEHPRRVFADSC
jgi:hypothetical protein